MKCSCLMNSFKFSTNCRSNSLGSSITSLYQYLSLGLHSGFDFHSLFFTHYLHRSIFTKLFSRLFAKKAMRILMLFDLFDLKQNGVIEFGEFVRSLSIFHPKAPEAEKVAFVFRLYDLRCTGYIERDELKELVLALLNELDSTLSNDAVEAIVDKTIMEADLKGDGRIDPEEWKELVARHPSIIKNMTVPYLTEITLAFPSFVLNTGVQESELASWK